MNEDKPDTIKITIKCHRSDTELLKKEIYEYLMSHRIGIDDIKIEGLEANAVK